MKDRPTISEEEFARRTAPTVRVFLGVDLENSAKLKHASPVDSAVVELLPKLLARDFAAIQGPNCVRIARAALTGSGHLGGGDVHSELRSAQKHMAAAPSELRFYETPGNLTL